MNPKEKGLLLDKKVLLQWEKPWELLAERDGSSKWLGREDSNHKNFINKSINIFINILRLVPPKLRNFEPFFKRINYFKKFILQIELILLDFNGQI